MIISISDLYQKYLTCSGVSTDTRKIEKDVMFFALKGPNFNANNFARQALEKGAAFAVVDEEQYVTDENILLVEDGLKALQQLANFHRKTLKIPFVGLTGSNGKTTSKELTNSVLSQKFRTYATKGNLNNHIGVPLTVLAIDSSVEIAIIEMGANKQGDIQELVEICEPTHGFITNIGKAHLEGFGGMEGVKKGKGELLDFLSASGGTVFVNQLNEILMDMVNARSFQEKIEYGQKGSFLSAKLLEEIPFVIYEAENGEQVHSHLTGSYNFENIVNALAIGKYFGVPAEKANKGISEYNPDNNRSQFVQKGSNLVLMDAYNANPSSMSAAITNFNNLKADKKMVILGDMFELGPDSPQEHEAIGKLLSTCNFDYILLAGTLMQAAVKPLPLMKVNYFPDKFGLHVWLQDHEIKNTHILVKGSRGMGLESVLPFLDGKF